MTRCGIIGVGRNVEDLHVPALRAMKDVEITAICDRDEQRLARFGAKYGIKKVYAGIKDFLAHREDFDFVDVSTPGFTHYAICDELIEAGVNFMVEKPFVLGLAETLRLKKKADRRKVKVCIIHNYRYRNPVLKARKAFDLGVIGRLKEVKSTYHGQSVFEEPTAWSWQEKKNKVFLYELPTIHLLDLQTYFAGPVTKVIGVTAKDDKALKSATELYATVEHAGGIVGMIDFQLLASSNYTHFEIFGSSNDVRIKFYPEYYRIYSGTVNPLDELYCDFRRIWDFAWPGIKHKMKRPSIARRALSHYRLFRAFVDALKDPAYPVPVSIDDIIPTMALLEELSRAVYG